MAHILSPSSLSTAPYQKSVTLKRVSDRESLGIVRAAHQPQALREGDALPGVPFRAPRTISMQTRPTGGEGRYRTGDADGVIVIGEDAAGDRVQDILVLSKDHGGETLVSERPFARLHSIMIPAQSSAAGLFTFGVHDVVMSFRALRAGGGGLLTYRCALDNSIDTIEVVDGETIRIAGTTLFGSSTATKISLFA